MSAKRPALGRGLDTLLAPTRQVPEATPERSSLRQVPIHEISPNPYQPRSVFEPEKLKELADSIREKGLLQPVLLRAKGSGFELVAGERRWRAAQQAGLREIPAILKDLDDREMLEAAVIENVQRDDLNPIEEARSYQRLTSEFGMTQDDLGKAIGRSRVAITNALRLLKLPGQVLQMVEEEQLTAGHARAILGLSSPEQQLSLAHEAARKGLSVREVESRVKRLQAPKTDRAPGHPRDGSSEDIREIQDRLAAHVGLRVRVHAKSDSSGTVEFSYSSLDEFQNLCSRLGLELEQSL